jgi:hypothetical protein
VAIAGLFSTTIKARETVLHSACRSGSEKDADLPWTTAADLQAITAKFRRAAWGAPKPDQDRSCARRVQDWLRHRWRNFINDGLDGDLLTTQSQPTGAAGVMMRTKS